MSTRQFGAPVKRNEDARLLAGRAQFVDDVSLPGMLHAAFVRSPHAHARHPVDRRRGGARPAGVVAVYTAQDLGDYWRPGPVIVPPPPVEGAVFNERTQVPLAEGQGAPRRRAGRDGGRDEPVHRRGRGRGRLRSTGSRCRSRPSSRRRRRPARRASTTIFPTTSPRGSGRRRATTPRRRSAPTRHRAPLRLRPRLRAADGDARRRGAVGRRERTADASGTRRRRRSRSATASRACSASPSGRCAWSRRSSAAASGRRSCCSTRTRCSSRGRRSGSAGR